LDLRINDLNMTGVQQTQQSQNVTDTGDAFSIALGRASNDALMERLQGLIEDIKTQGKKLGKHMDIRDMRKYRSLITEFLGEVVGNSHKFSRENFLDRRGRHRVYGLVKLVNKELDELAQELLKAEKDHIAILDKTDEILGLLLDILI